jgi:hypothetical protein
MAPRHESGVISVYTMRGELAGTLHDAAALWRLLPRGTYLVALRDRDGSIRIIKSVSMQSRFSR